MNRNIAYAWFLVMLTAVAPAVRGQQAGAQFHVNCDGGGLKLSHAIELAQLGDTIEVRGTCRERVRVTRGPLTLDGGGNAILDGAGVGPNEQEFNGLLTVDAAQGVTIRGWTIQNSTGEGIFGVHGANMLIQDTVVEKNFTGIGLSNSSAEVMDIAIRYNSNGLDAYSASTVIFRGDIDISRNTAESLTLNGNSHGEIRGAHLQVSNNPAGGVIISAQSSLAIFGFQTSQTSRLTTNNNQGPGIVIGQSQLFVAGAGFAPGSIGITSRGNAGPGVLLVNGNISNPFGAARLVIENNPIGMQFLQGSTATITGGLNVRNNIVGIRADNATGLTFASLPPNPSAVQSNGTDVFLTFGTKSTINGLAVGTIVCDATVLSRGTTTCP
jgi:parallel beta helix pectate lyase-like protein